VCRLLASGILGSVGSRAAAGAVAGLAALTLSGCIDITASTDLSAVGRTCTRAVDKAIAGMGDQYTARDFLDVGDGGGSLSVSSPVNGVNGAIAAALAVGCVLEETDAPNAIKGEVQDVSELDGRQEASWGDLTMSYVMDEDKGLTAVLTPR